MHRNHSIFVSSRKSIWKTYKNAWLVQSGVHLLMVDLLMVDASAQGFIHTRMIQMRMCIICLSAWCELIKSKRPSVVMITGGALQTVHIRFVRICINNISLEYRPRIATYGIERGSCPRITSSSFIQPVVDGMSIETSITHVLCAMCVCVSPCQQPRSSSQARENWYNLPVGGSNNVYNASVIVIPHESSWTLQIGRRCSLFATTDGDVNDNNAHSCRCVGISTWDRIC